MEPCDWLLANEEVSRLSGDCGGVMRLGLLHSECDREPGFRGRGVTRGRTSQGFHKDTHVDSICEYKCNLKTLCDSTVNICTLFIYV